MSNLPRSREVWAAADSRTGKPVGVTRYPSRQSVQDRIDDWVARDKRGGRPDLHDLIPFLVPKLVYLKTYHDGKARTR